MLNRARRFPFVTMVLIATMWLSVLTGFAITTAPEDSRAFNCYLSGNHECAPDYHGWGFVNG